MSRQRTRGVVFMTAMVGLVVSVYFLSRQYPGAEDTSELSVDLEGVFLDFLEMDDRLTPPRDVLQSSFAAGRRLKDQPASPTDGAASIKFRQLNQSEQLKPGNAPDKSSLEGEKKQLGDLLSERRVSLLGEDQLRVANSSNLPEHHLSASQDHDDVDADPVLSLPVPFATLPVDKLLELNWIQELRQLLKRLPRGLSPISIVMADYKFRDVLLNWIIASKTQANPPLTHVVVLSLDQPLCEILKRRKLSCIFIAPPDFLTPAAIASLTKHIVFSEVMVLRLTAMRLMNHWGYDVANYDTDAIILKSPESLYLRHADSHMIGSYGHHPGELGRVWGTTVCCGVFMTRSSKHTEMFWNTMTTILPNSMNDQARLNYALSALEPDWGETQSKSILKDEWVAMTTSGFKVTVLPARYICRQGCSRKHQLEYYVWHKGGQSSDGKINVAQRGRLWFLRRDWELRTVNSSSSGDDWLKEITEPVP